MPDIPEIPTQLARGIRYLKDRAIPTDDLSMRRNGIEIRSGSYVQDVLGTVKVDPTDVCLLYRYPGEDYVSARIVGKYPLCPAGQLPACYRNAHVDWDNPTDNTLVLCESVLKAIIWGQRGWYACAGGGVATLWMSGRKKWATGFPHHLIEAGAFTRVLIAFDNDTEGSNKNVSRAVRLLVRALVDRHPNLDVKVQVLPDPPDEWRPEARKRIWGVDDAVAYYDDEWFESWADNADFQRVPDRDELQESLDELNELYAYDHESGKVFNIERGFAHSPSSFITGLEAPRKVLVDGKRKKVAPIWVEWPDRTEVQGQCFYPGGDRMHEGQLNRWQDDGVQPVSGDPGPFLEFLHNAIRDDAICDLLIDCLAYKVQNRSTRFHKLLFFCGRQTGTGKSTLASYIMAKILGRSNYGPIGKTEIDSQYTAPWAEVELAVLDDCEGMNKASWAKFKNIITEDEQLITQKYHPAYSTQIYTMFIITANDTDVIKFDAEDRRIFMVEFDPKVHHTGGEGYWNTFRHWLDKEDGLGIIHHYLLQRDLSKFDPEFQPPWTAQKEAALEASQDEVDLFFNDLLNAPGEFFEEGRMFCTARELFMLCYQRPPMDMSDQRVFTQRLNSRMWLHTAHKRVNLEVEGKRGRVATFYLPGVEQLEYSQSAIAQNIKESEPKV